MTQRTPILTQEDKLGLAHRPSIVERESNISEPSPTFPPSALDRNRPRWPKQLCTA